MTLLKQLPGPILILGASGFVGANLMRMIYRERSDVFAVATRAPAWRLSDLPSQHIIYSDLTQETNVLALYEQVKPAVIFDCIAYGGYSFEKNIERIYAANLYAKINLINEAVKRHIYCYIHAGSSSEYGENSAAPKEGVMTTPNSHYAVTKCAIDSLLYYAGKHQDFRCANLRLYSTYGPFEDSARLVPAAIINGLSGKLPPFVKPDTSRDFIYVDDVCDAFITAAVNLPRSHYGESFNIGTGHKTTIREFAHLIQEIFAIETPPQFASMDSRMWDTSDWYADASKAKDILHWEAKTSLRAGLAKTIAWYQSWQDKNLYREASKQNIEKNKGALEKTYSVSAIIACYKDGQAIPYMAERLVNTFEKCGTDYEIIFVNDGSPDNSEDVIQELSQKNPRILGITHARNFGSQAAFRSGMELASKNAVVLLDGDLQDPPELIEAFIAKWKEGYDVVYGIRVKREASLFMQFAYKCFYRLFNWFSSVKIPNDAGDFSLIDKRVVKWLLACHERDLYLRGLRAYVGFKQTGVDYIRPERMFGKTTNSLLKNFGWVKKSVFSFSRTPLDILTMAGFILIGITILLAVFQISMHFINPANAPKGITTILLLIMFFGSFTILSVSVVGEYIAKIFEEVKARPIFIRKNLIKRGVIISNDDSSCT